VSAFFNYYPASDNIIVQWDSKYRHAFKSRDGKGFIVEVPDTLGFTRYPFMPVLGVRDFNVRRHAKFNKKNYKYTGHYGPEIPSNLRKALAGEHLLAKMLTHEGYDVHHVYKSGWGFANPDVYVDDKGEIHTRSRFDIEIHEDGQARKLIDVVGVYYSPGHCIRTSPIDPRIFEDKRRAKIYIAWSTNYSLSAYALCRNIKISNMYGNFKEASADYKAFINDLWYKRVGFFPKETRDIILDALHNQKIIRRARSKYNIRKWYVDLFEFADDLYEKDRADFKLINLRANRKLFGKRLIPIKDLLPRAVSPDELE